MTTMETIENLMKDSAAMEKIAQAATPDELAAALKECGIVLESMTKEEAFAAFCQAKDGELDEDDLDQVAGGYFLNVRFNFLFKFFKKVPVYCPPAPKVERYEPETCPTL